MISLHPDPSTESFSPLHRVLAEPRAADGRPWVLSNMIASADGATAIDGLSGGLGGPADAEMFVALRATADAILVGADTVRAERYRRPGGGGPDAAAARRAQGRAALPLIVVVTASGRLDPTLPMFDDGYRPLILTSAGADRAAIGALGEVADIVVLGERMVPLDAALTELGRRGHRIVLSEGGPSLNGQLVASGLIDEWNLTISPLLAGGDSHRSASWRNGPEQPTAMTLDRVWLGDELLFCRWVRASLSSNRA